MTKILNGCLDGIKTASSNEKKMLEYVRSGDFLFDSPTYLKVDVVVIFFYIHMHVIVIVTIAIS